MVTNPRGSPETETCKSWLAALVESRAVVVVPEIADYEVRRELLRLNRSRGLARLDALKALLGFAPITSPAMLKAAEFWAAARNAGKPMADDAALDADVILAGQAAVLARDGDQPIVATTSIRHLGLFVDARHWQNVR